LRERHSSGPTGAERTGGGERNEPGGDPRPVGRGSFCA
jgi:hypothetical protein